MAAIVIAGCGAHNEASNPTETVTAAPSTVTVTASPTTPVETILPTTAEPTKTSPALRSGPRSTVADIDLPEGTTQCPNNSCINLVVDDPNVENWQYTAPFESLVTFLSNQFANGPRYDAYGATSWMGLPPCYFQHTSPPLGGYPEGDNNTHWFWAWGKGSQSLVVTVNDLDHTIGIYRRNDESEWNGKNCRRS